ncbi:MAG: Acetylglutamate kinase [Deltaproteobacteria bacterium ADurb.Bin510]|nr:MAG: Acetylglutamate kinase [Deltaproteobacteria bacterium ADurb.Bin510]
MNEAAQRVRFIAEALPYIRDFRGKRVVIKYGGHAMIDPELKRMFARQIVLLQYVGLQVVVVHGGGPQISSVLKQMGVESSFVAGRRVTDARTMDVVEMVLAGGVNKEIVNLLNLEGGRAVGLSGKDGGLIKARKLFYDQDGEILDIGQVGEIAEVNPQVIETLEHDGFIAVVAPLGVDDEGTSYNINADTAAAQMAAKLKAEKLIILTDESGVLDKDKQLISSMDVRDVKHLIQDGVVTGGMIPKLECCVDALNDGVGKAHILDGRVPYSIFLELMTDSGIGTQIIKGI